MHGMRIGAYDDGHVQCPGSLYRVAEKVGFAQTVAAILQGNLGWVVGDVAACAQHYAIGVNALEIVEPEIQVRVNRIVFRKGQLRPAHGPVLPVLGAVDQHIFLVPTLCVGM